MYRPWFSRLLQKLNDLIHLFIALALAGASILVIVQFGKDVWHGLHAHNLTLAFLHALGTLFILWVLSSLIGAETTYLRDGTIPLTVFVEVALITLLRQLILIPVEGDTGHSGAWQGLDFYWMIIAAVLVVGIAYYLVSRRN